MSTDYELVREEAKNLLCLRRQGQKGMGVFIDFESSLKDWRRQRIGPASDPLAKALGFEKGLRVMDMTLGLAQDALRLCHYGAEVVGYESHPLIYALLENAYERGNQWPAVQRLQIRFGSSLQNFEAHLEDCEAFYFDPMFLHKRKALPKKEMQYLADLVEVTSEDIWIPVIEKLQAAKKRVVVKRADKAPFLAELKPTRSVESKMLRFDIYS